MSGTEIEGDVDGERRPIVNDDSKPKGMSKRTIILFVVAMLVLVVIIVVVASVVHKKKASPPDELTHCPSYQNTSSSTVPGTGSTGETWRAANCSSSSACPQGFDSPHTIMISLDGFRRDYLDRGLTPNLQQLMDCGTSADYMRPAFPSLTFPNHYTLVTGLYPESHGIIGNFMYDKTFKDIFTLSGDPIKQSRWWNGEPIWNTVKKAGKRAAAFFWPGAESYIHDMRPDYCYAYNKKLPFEWRVDGVLSWLDLPVEERPDMINLYFSQPDSAGHDYGPDSPEVDSNITRVDGIIGMLMDGITNRSLEHCINIVVISDHGMAYVNCSEMIDLSVKINPENHFVYTGPVGRVTGEYNYGPSGDIIEYPTPTESAESITSKLECHYYNDTIEKYSRAYLKQHLPKRFHHAVSPRIEDVIVLTEDERLVTTKQLWDKDCKLIGDHGFDNAWDHMKATFIAYGPSIKQNHTIEGFENIEVYNFLTDLLNVSAAPQNGTTGRLYDVLVSHPPYPGPDPPMVQYDNCTLPDQDERHTRRKALPQCACDDLHMRKSAGCACAGNAGNVFPVSDFQRCMSGSLTSGSGENVPGIPGACATCNFTYLNLTSLTEDEADLLLNLTTSETEESTKKHLPTGVPSLQVDSATCLMTQRDYITGYNYEVRMPVWAAYTLEKQTMGTFNATDNITCVRPDVRLGTEQATSCDHYVDDKHDITWEYLYPPGYTKADNTTHLDAYIATNIVPMYASFKNGIWRESHELIEAYVQKYDKVQVISGPVFDNNYDGLRDDKDQRKSLVGSGPVPLPTHFFHTLTRCSTGQEFSNCTGELDTMTIVIPHNSELGNCWDIAPQGLFKYLEDNVARIKDVEQLTALGFHDGISDNSERIILRTHLSVDLWPLV